VSPTTNITILILITRKNYFVVEFLYLSHFCNRQIPCKGNLSTSSTNSHSSYNCGKHKVIMDLCCKEGFRQQGSISSTFYAHCLLWYFCAKNYKAKRWLEKSCSKHFCTEKIVHKMLMKLTPDHILEVTKQNEGLPRLLSY